jgi:phytoene synthase
MKELFDIASSQTATVVTNQYSTSFSIAVKMLDKSIRQSIYDIYGFVRVADEIVDSFEGYPQEDLLNRFEDEYTYARKVGISSNPIIHAFQNVVTQYNINEELVAAFMKSMRADLSKAVYETEEEIAAYIYGSADVVGLMCLQVFVKGDVAEYEKLKEPAMKLGSAFQKVNFLRDFKQDFEELSRTYFPNLDPNNITKEDKDLIVAEIQQEFDNAYAGIKLLPNEAKLGVYVAYNYYLKLLHKIDKTTAETLIQKRIRVTNFSKSLLLIKSYFKYKLNLI